MVIVEDRKLSNARVGMNDEKFDYLVDGAFVVPILRVALPPEDETLLNKNENENENENESESSDTKKLVQEVFNYVAPGEPDALFPRRFERLKKGEGQNHLMKKIEQFYVQEL